MRKRSDLRKYQRRFARIIIREKTVYLGLDMGAGKTAICLTAARVLLDQFAVRRWLIVAPLRVAKDTWPDEIEAWEHTRVMSYSLVRAEDDDPDIVAAGKEAYSLARLIGMGQKEAEKERRSAIAKAKDAKRRAAVECGAEITIINREQLPWLFRTYGRSNWPFDGLIYDEASRLKGGKKRTEKKKFSEFGALARVRQRFEYVVLLSGTPAPNGLQDLWGPFYIIDLGKRLGATITAFRRRWFDVNQYNYSVTPKPYAFKQIMERVEDVMFSLDPDEYPELPPVTYNNVIVKLPQRVIEEYRRFKKSLVSEAYDVEAVNRGVLTGKLLQFSNGSMYRNIVDGPKKKSEVVHIHDLKIAALESVIEEAAGAPVLVAYSFEFDLERLRKRWPKAVVYDEEPNFVKKWNAGKIKLAFVHPASAGHGLNIQHGGNIAVWYGLTWSLEIYQQFNKRLWRPGQTKPVFIHHIVCEDTDDLRVLDVLKDKDTTQQDVIEAVRMSVLTH